MAHYLITGTSGLIGSHLAWHLAEAGHTVTAISRQPFEAMGQSHELIQSLPLDLATLDCTQLPPSVDGIIHLAQSENFRDFPGKALDVFSVNTLSTLKLLDYAYQTGCKNVIWASTGGVYPAQNEPLSEDKPVIFSSTQGFYPTSKWCAELVAENYRAHLTVATLRFFFVYGPRQRESMLIPRLIRTVLDGRPVTLQGQEGLHLNPTYVSDAVLAIETLLKQPQSVTLNIAGPETLSLRALVSLIGELTGKTPVFECQETAVALDVVADITRLSETLLSPQVSPRAGLIETIKAMAPEALALSAV